MMKKGHVILPRGTVVKFHGLPVMLEHDTVIYTATDLAVWCKGMPDVEEDVQGFTVLPLSQE
jgi:hypothetical protein